MDRNQAKELLPAITHFANGGELWSYEGGRWNCQVGVNFNNYSFPINVIQDKHFEARKAHALGEGIEYDNGTEIEEWRICYKPYWLKDTKYRPKPKEVYEWQWYFQENDGEFKLTPFWVEDMCNTHKWTKFEPSKRLKKDT